MDSGPVASYQVHEHLRPRVRASSYVHLSFDDFVLKTNHVMFTRLQLCDLYENDSIFDKFECCLSGDGSRVATGSYRFDCLSSFQFSTSLSYIRDEPLTCVKPAIYSAYLERLKEVLKLQRWKLAKIR